MNKKIYAYLKKNFVAKVLILVLLATANVGLVVAVREYLASRPTPVAEISRNRDFGNGLQGDIDALTQEVESIGGSVSQYKNEDDYLKSQAEAERLAVEQARQERNATIDTYDNTFQPVSQKIIVIDSQNNVLSNAMVLLAGVPRYTSVDGFIQTTIDTEFVEMIVEYPGYMPYIEFLQVTGSTKVVTLRKPSDAISIFGVVLDYNDDTVNLITQNYGIDISDNDIDSANIQIIDNLGDGEKTYTIYQNSTPILTSNTGVWSSIALKEKFKEGENISVGVVYEGIESELIPLRLQFVDSYYFDIEKAFLQSLGVGDKVPGLDEDFQISQDNDVLNFVLPNILAIIAALSRFKGNGDKDISYTYNNIEKEFVIAIGFTIWDKDISKERQQNTFKKIGKKIETLGDGSWVDKFSKWLDEDGDFRKNDSGKATTLFGKSFNFSIDLLGTFTFSTENGFKLINAQVGVNFGITLKLSWTVIVVVVPVYFTLEVGAELYLSLDLVINAFVLTFNIYIKAGFGVGIGNLIGVGFAAKGEFEFTLQIGGPDIDDQFDGKGGFDFSVIVEAFVLFFHYEHIFIDKSHEWDWFDSELNGDSFQKIDFTNYTDTQLYQDSRVKIVQIGDKLVATYLEVNPTDSNNPTRLMYQVYQNGEWGTAKPLVVDKDTPDFYSDLYELNGDVYSVWQSFDKPISDQDSMTDIASASQIYISKFDASTNTFEKPQQITNNDKWTTLPKLTTNDAGQITAVWIQNDENDIFGTTGKNSIEYSTMSSNGNWSNPTELYSTTKTIDNFEPIYSNNQLMVSANISSSDDIFDSSSKDVYLISKNSATNITNSDTYAGSARFVDYQGSAKLFFNNDNKISYVDINSSTNIIDIVDNFTGDFFTYNTIDGLVLTYLDSVNGTTQIKKMLYDNTSKQWINDVQVTNSEYDITQYDAVVDNSGNLEVLYQQFEQDDDRNIAVSQLGYETDASVQYDLELVDVQYSESFDTENTNTIYAEIKNLGSNSFDSIKYNINGYNAIVDLAEPLLPNQSTLVALDFDYDISDKVEIFVEISNHEESDYTNNTLAIVNDFMYYDMNMSLSQDGTGIATLNIQVDNKSYIDDEFRIQVSTIDGDVLYIGEWISIEKVSSKNIRLILDCNELNIASDTLLKVELVSKTRQLYNKYELIYLDGYIIKPQPVYNPWRDMLYQAKALMPNLWGWN